MIAFSPVAYAPELLSKYVALFSACFPGNDKFSLPYLRWLYCDNPAGSAIGFDAWDGEQLAGHYACVPAYASCAGARIKTMLSLNTATHPAYQGQGLFTQLAERTYAAAAAAGIASVHGVANANSTPGFVRKLGFRLIEPLRACIGFGSLHTDYALLAQDISFVRAWSPDTLAWRCANPANRVRHRQNGDLVQFSARGQNSLLSAYAELPARDIAMPDDAPFASPGSRLFLGLIPDRARRFHFYADIPTRLRPSPLNFIYRSLADNAAPLEKGNISLTFLDFDAY